MSINLRFAKDDDTTNNRNFVWDITKVARTLFCFLMPKNRHINMFQSSLLLKSIVASLSGWNIICCPWKGQNWNPNYLTICRFGSYLCATMSVSPVIKNPLNKKAESQILTNLNEYQYHHRERKIKGQLISILNVFRRFSRNSFSHISLNLQ